MYFNPLRSDIVHQFPDPLLRTLRFLRHTLLFSGCLLGTLHGSANNIRTANDAPLILPIGCATRIGSCTGKTFSTPFSFREVPEIDGTVNVSVEDELTYFLPSGPLVAGAHVVISDINTSIVYADGYSNAGGVFSASNIPEGTHNITVTEPAHTSYQGIFVLNPGATLDLHIFISRVAVLDEDSDGHFTPLDCNDADPSIHPGAPEICSDGIDNDCDGAVDEVSTYFADADGDGFGNPAVDSLACSIPAGYVANNTDQCPTDQNKTAPGTCGCGVADTDTDGDGTANCLDGCPLDPNKTAPGACGCGATDTDSDSDGIPDCVDSCPTVAGQIGSPCDDGDVYTTGETLDATCGCSVAPVSGDYRSINSGSWGDASIWQVYSGGSFGPTSVPPNATSGTITVRAPHLVLVNSPTVADQVTVQAGATLSQTSTFSVSNGPGADLVVRGLFNMNNSLDGGGTVVIANGGVFESVNNLCTVQAPVTLQVDAGGTANKGGGTTSSLLTMLGTVNNSGTWNMNGGRMQGSSSGPSTFNNLAGGVININGWFTPVSGHWLGLFMTNAGTINKYNAAFDFNLFPSRFKNLATGVVNANLAGLTISVGGIDVVTVEQYGTFNIASGATLRVSSNFGFRFLGPQINNNGTFPIEGIRFMGSAVQQLNGTGTISSVIVENPFGVTLGGTQTITSSFTLTSGNLTLGNNNLVLNASGLVGGSASSYLVTSGNGSLKRNVSNNATDVLFPVGTATSYLPALLRLDGASTPDLFSVRAANGVSTAYDTNDDPIGSAITTNTLLRAWVVREAVNGGSNAALRLEWSAGDEGSGFSSGACRVSRNDGSAWDAPADGPASGAGPFTRERSAITAFGLFTVHSGLIDICPGGPEPGTACNDSNDCTINDVIGTNCLCAGTFADADADGTCDAEDCAPGNPSVHPGAAEICDGLDNDCDGSVDEGLGDFYADSDGDGLGDPDQPVPCSTPGAVQDNTDCDDSDPAPCVVTIEDLVERRVVGNAGGTAQIGGVHVEWTLGEALVSTIEDNGLRLTQGFHQTPVHRLRLNLRALLQGPFMSPATGMMDSLRTGGWIPIAEPYTALGYVHVGGGGEATSSSVLAVVGLDAIVDWIVVELRDPVSPELVVATRTGLLQRDGDIVDVDGISPLAFAASAANYRVAVLHRNHLPVITAAPVPLSTVPADLDLTDGSTPLYGFEPTLVEGAVQLLWSGDVNADGLIRYTGEFNDRDPILSRIGGLVPTNTTDGYLPEDLNMDGRVKYTGTNNDRELILFNIGGLVPTNVRNAQMP